MKCIRASMALINVDVSFSQEYEATTESTAGGTYRNKDEFRAAMVRPAGPALNATGSAVPLACMHGAIGSFHQHLLQRGSDL